MKTLLRTTHVRSGIKLGFLSFSGCRSLLFFLFRRMIFRLCFVDVYWRSACWTWSVRFSRNFLLTISNFKHKFNWFLRFLGFHRSLRQVCRQENYSIYNSKQFMSDDLDRGEQSRDHKSLQTLRLLPSAISVPFLWCFLLLCFFPMTCKDFKLFRNFKKIVHKHLHYSNFCFQQNLYLSRPGALFAILKTMSHAPQRSAVRWPVSTQSFPPSMMIRFCTSHDIESLLVGWRATTCPRESLRSLCSGQVALLANMWYVRWQRPAKGSLNGLLLVAARTNSRKFWRKLQANLVRLSFV